VPVFKKRILRAVAPMSGAAKYRVRNANDMNKAEVRRSQDLGISRYFRMNVNPNRVSEIKSGSDQAILCTFRKSYDTRRRIPARRAAVEEPLEYRFARWPVRKILTAKRNELSHRAAIHGSTPESPIKAKEDENRGGQSVIGFTWP